MRVQDVVAYLESLYPLSEMEEWDHSGMQIGSREQVCQKVMVALNADEGTITQALAASCDLLVTHHPFLFHPLTSLEIETYRGGLIARALSGHLSIYSMHTNYDRLRMNTLLLEKLGCTNIEPFESTRIPRLGHLPMPMALEAFIEHVKRAYDLPLVRYTGKPKAMLRKIAVCGGSGSEFVNDALDQADIFLTGDFNYNHATNLLDHPHGLVLGIPHFVEALMKADVQKSLQVFNIDVLLADEKDYFIYR